MAAKRAVRVEEGAKRVRAYLGGRLVADTRRPRLVWEVPHYPAYYFPREDVVAGLLPAAGVPASGEPVVLDVHAGDVVAAGAARGFCGATPQLQGLVRFDWDAMDEWLEEDEPVYVHPRDPYTRVDILASSRHVRVEVGGVTVADSRAPRVLFETGLPPRYYLPLPDVQRELLRPSATTSRCPYKGTAAYWSVDIDGVCHPDLAWIYRAPVAESLKIAGLICFFDERVDVHIDGDLQQRPRTPFG